MIRQARPRRLTEREIREIEKDHPMGGAVPDKEPLQIVRRLGRRGGGPHARTRLSGRGARTSEGIVNPHEEESDDRADFAEEWAREDKLDREREWDESYAYVDDERTW